MYEDGISPLLATLPPYEELKEIDDLRGSNFSISQYAESERDRLRSEFLAEVHVLQGRFERFKNSKTFLSRLAAASAHAGDLEGEGHYLDQLQEVDPSEFARNLKGEHLVRRGDVAGAEQFFGSLQLERNVHANLRLASFYVVRGELKKAAERVSAALSIDPVDYSARLFDGSLKILFGEYERAILSLRIATEERPNSAIAFTNMGVAYVRLGKPERALVCVKRAVALNPLSETAVALFADIANGLDCSDEAVPALRYFVRFEQQSAPMWARLGRALIHIQEFGEAIAALKRQSSVEDAPDLWNNMGVAHYLRGDEKKAGEDFVHAMRLSNDPTDYSFCLAAKNAAALLARLGKHEDALHFVDSVLLEENRQMILKRDDLSQLILIRLDALNKLGESDSANQFAEYVLSMEDASVGLRGWVASGLLTQYALRNDKRGEAAKLAEEWLHVAKTLPSKKQRVQVLNNVAFSFIEAGLLEEGEAALSKIAFAIHKEPYPTATLGLLYLRRGNFEMAASLYAEAVSLCNSSEDRARIRQKWNLEEAILYVNSDPRKALRLAEKAWSEEKGEPLLVKKAGELLKPLRQIALSKK